MYDYSDLISVASEYLRDAFSAYAKADEAEQFGFIGLAAKFSKQGDEFANSAARLFEHAREFNWKHLPGWQY